MSSFPVVLSAPIGEHLNTYTDERYPVGTQLEYDDGRRYRFIKAGASALVAGTVVQAPATAANHVALAVQAAVAAGAKTIPVTFATTDISADQYKDGFIVITTTPGNGYAYRIDTHPACLATATPFSVPLAAGEFVKVALTTASRASLVANPYNSVIIHPSPPTQSVVGVACTATAASNWGWVLVRGPMAVLTDGTVTAGKIVVPSPSVDGAASGPVLTEGTPNTGFDQQIIGRVLRVEADTLNSLINVQIG